jgi:cytochrome c oxidase cbb3-type subunit 1
MSKTRDIPPADYGFVSTDPEIAAVDASVRWPVLACFLSAVHWLVVGTFLLVYASSMTHPQDTFPILGLLVDLAANCSFFTYGHIWPAAINALVYGWASTSGLGLAIWLLARMGRTPARAPGALMTGIVFWNLGVATGLTGIFLGDSTSVEFLEFPAYASWILWVAYALFGLWAVATYLGRKANHDHIAEWWLLVALFAFPWLYATGTTLLCTDLHSASADLQHTSSNSSWVYPLPGSGVVQNLLDAWYVHGIFTLWLAPLGLALLYYLIPKMSGLDVQWGSRCKFAFWSWILIAPWTAVHDLVGGPYPADTVTVGLILSGVICIPVAFIGMNLVGTAMRGESQQGHHGGIVFPFLVLGAVFFVVAGITEQLLSIRAINTVLRFTMFREFNMFLWVYGFFSFTVFGSMYYIVPRLLNFGWRSAFLIKAHYYASLYGILLMVIMLGVGGIMQGVTLENADPVVTIVNADQVALNWYIGSTACICLISIGNGIFALHLGWMLLDWLRQRVQSNRLASEILCEPFTPETPEVSKTDSREVSV